MRSTRRLTLVVLFAALVVPGAGAGATLGKKPPPSPSPPPPTTATFVKNYADVVSGIQASATPEDVQATSDGGTIALASVPSPDGVDVNWVTKLSSVGGIQWQEEVGCLSTAPGDYSIGVSLQVASDGGYVLAGGTIGCGSGSTCPVTSGLTCGFVEKLTSTGTVSWARAYAVGVDGTIFNGIRQTSDGGYVAVGVATDANNETGGLAVKLDANGNLVWESTFGPSSTFQADFQSVTPAAGGYVATGRLAAGDGRFSLAVVKFDVNGNLVWQHAYNTVANGSPSASTQPFAIIGTSDGGYAVTGAWNSTSGPGTCCSGSLLLKLDSLGALQWQQAYEGGVYCFFNGFSETCTSIGGVAYGVRQTSDGGFVLAGDANIEMTDGAPLEPWLARTDSAGQLVWQENVYRVNPQTGRPLSENFSGVALTNAGIFALGFTENVTSGKGELLGVSTDSGGQVASTCTDVHAASLFSAANPGLVDLNAHLPVASGTAAGLAGAPVKTLATSGTASAPQC